MHPAEKLEHVIQAYVNEAAADALWRSQLESTEVELLLQRLARKEWEPRWTTFQGKRGFWVTLRDGRKVFIEERPGPGKTRYVNRGVSMKLFKEVIALHEEIPAKLRRRTARLEVIKPGLFRRVLLGEPRSLLGRYSPGDKRINIYPTHARRLGGREKHILRQVIWHETGHSVFEHYRRFGTEAEKKLFVSWVKAIYREPSITPYAHAHRGRPLKFAHESFAEWMRAYGMRKIKPEYWRLARKNRPRSTKLFTRMLREFQK